jgi:hypothetical protein
MIPSPIHVTSFGNNTYKEGGVFQSQYLKQFVQSSKYERVSEASYSFSPFPGQVAICVVNEKNRESRTKFCARPFRFQKLSLFIIYTTFKKDIQI